MAHVVCGSLLSRRTFLRAAGIAVSLPMLEAMRPALAAGAATGPSGAAAAKPRRMVGVETNMGILPQFFFPEKPGQDYDADART